MDYPKISYPVMHEALTLAHLPGMLYEVRLSRNNFLSDFGYFDNATLAADTIAAFWERGADAGYYTGNPCNPDLRARSYNHLTRSTNRGLQTKDKEILWRRSFVIDIDPIRPSGVSATHTEHEAALMLAQDVANVLEFRYGWPKPQINDTGNGAHLVYYMHLPNTDEITALCRSALYALAKMFDTETVHIDTTVFNASRIFRLPGLLNCKGDHLPDRPHRLSLILTRHDPLRLLTAADLERFTGAPTEAAGRAPGFPAVHHAAPLSLSLVAPLAGSGDMLSLDGEARARIHDWVPHFLPQARDNGQGGYTVESDALNRTEQRQERLSIQANGKITDFGNWDMPGELKKGDRTATEVIAEFYCGGDKAEAARLLAQHLKRPVTQFAPLKIEPEIPQQPQPELIDPLTLGAPDPDTELLWEEPKQMHDARGCPDIIPGIVMGEGHGCIAATQKFGKSTIVYQMLLCLVTGFDFLGCSVVQQEKVAIICFEETRASFRDKINIQYDALCKLNGLPVDPVKKAQDLSKIKVICLGDRKVYDDIKAGRMSELHPARFPGDIQAFLTKNPDCGVFVIDTIDHIAPAFKTAFAGVTDWEAAYVQRFIQIALDTRTVVISVEHHRKANSKALDGDIASELQGSYMKQSRYWFMVQFRGSAERDDTGKIPKAKLSTRGRYATGSHSNVPTYVERVSAGGAAAEDETYLFRRVDLPKLRAGAKTASEDTLLAAMHADSTKYYVMKDLEKLTGLNRYQLDKAIKGLVFVKAIVDMQINAKTTAYAIPNSVGFSELTNQYMFAMHNIPKPIKITLPEL